MAGKLTLAAVVLALGLTAAGCGSADQAGTTASRWDGNQDKAIQYQNEARGPLSDGTYSADGKGRVTGFDRTDGQDRAQDRASEAGREMRKAGRDLAKGAKDAAESVGDMAEEALDGMTQGDRDRAAHVADPQRN